MAEKKSFLMDLGIVFVLLCLTLVGLAGVSDAWDLARPELQIASNMPSLTANDNAFWVPQVDGRRIYVPFLEIWSLSAIYSIVPAPSAFILRLPSVFINIITGFIAFLCMYRVSSRKTAWLSLGAFLTMPVLLMTTAHPTQGLWFTAATAIPLCIFLFVVSARSKRERHVCQAFFALSLAFSFFASGFCSILFILVVILLSCLIARKFYCCEQLNTRYFFVPLLFSLLAICLTFSQYQTELRYTLEDRAELTLQELNREMGRGHVTEIAMRDHQIIGQLSEASEYCGQDCQFILVGTTNAQQTNYSIVFSENRNEYQQFRTYCYKLFGYEGLPPRTTQKSPRLHSTAETFRFFMLDALPKGEQLSELSLSDHWDRFVSWVLALFNGLFPWCAFFPLFVLFTRTPGSRLSSELDEQPKNAGKQPKLQQTILLSWLIIAFLTMVYSSHFIHQLWMPVSVPVALLSGWLLSSSLFWKGLQTKPRMNRFHMGFALAVTVVIFVSLLIWPEHLMDYITYPDASPGMSSRMGWVAILLCVIFIGLLGFCWYKNTFSRKNEEENLSTSQEVQNVSGGQRSGYSSSSTQLRAVHPSEEITFASVVDAAIQPRWVIACLAVFFSIGCVVALSSSAENTPEDQTDVPNHSSSIDISGDVIESDVK